jgi:hypothetical protein
MLSNIVEIDEGITFVRNMWSRSCYLFNQEGGIQIALGDARCSRFWPN